MLALFDALSLEALFVALFDALLDALLDALSLALLPQSVALLFALEFFIIIFLLLLCYKHYYGEKREKYTCFLLSFFFLFLGNKMQANTSQKRDMFFVLNEQYKQTTVEQKRLFDTFLCN